MGGNEETLHQQLAGTKNCAGTIYNLAEALSEYVADGAPPSGGEDEGRELLREDDAMSSSSSSVKDRACWQRSNIKI